MGSRRERREKGRAWRGKDSGEKSRRESGEKSRRERVKESGEKNRREREGE